MPADGFDAAAKKSGPRHVPLAAPKRAMGGTYISGKDVGRGMAVTMSRYTATIRGQADVSQTSSSRRDRPTADFRAAVSTECIRPLHGRLRSNDRAAPHGR